MSTLVNRFEQLCRNDQIVRRLALNVSEHEFDLFVDFLAERKPGDNFFQVIAALSNASELNRKQDKFEKLIKAIFNRR